MEIALEIVAWSLRQHWACGLPIICFIFLMCLPAFRDTAQNPEDHERWLKRLRNNSRAERYCSVLRDWLNLLDSRLSSHEAHQGPAQKAQNFGLLNITMALALAYPILAITIQWLCGHAIDFGGQEVIAASPPRARIFTAVWLGSSFLVYLFAATSKPRWRSLLFMFATWILGLGSIYADGFAVPRNVAVAEERSSRSMVWRLSYCGVLVAFLIMAIKMPDDFGASQRNQAVFLIVSLGLLQLFNALFDFLSTGLTRYLLRLGIDKKRAAQRAILDGLGGIAIFFALGCTLITFFTFVTPVDGAPLVDLAQLFANLRTTPGNYICLMINMFSTLLPTLLHLSLALIALALHYPTCWRNFVSALLERGAQSRQASFLSGVCICAMITFAVCVPIWIIAAVVTHDKGATLNAVL